MSLDTTIRVRCPRCDGDEVRLSRRRTWRDLPHLLLRQSPFRCYGCGFRFFAPSRLAFATAKTVGTPGRPDLDVPCPSCSKPIHLLLSPAERQEAWMSGWYVSCPSCNAAFVHHP